MTGGQDDQLSIPENAQHRSTFFQTTADLIRSGNETTQGIRVLACRDAFPKELIPGAKRPTQIGMSLRMN